MESLMSRLTRVRAEEVHTVTGAESPGLTVSTVNW